MNWLRSRRSPMRSICWQSEFESSGCRWSLTIIAMLFLLTARPSIATAEENSNKPKPPNIILIMADDVGWEAFGCYQGEDYRTPNIDRLASQGLRFNHCYSTPICTTSRVKIMTGKYNFRNYTHFGYLNPQEKTFAHLLKDAGYKTAIAGKWQLNGLTNRLPGHDDSSRPHQAGFDEYMLWQLTAPKNAKKGGIRGGERFWCPTLEHNGKFLDREANAGKYGPDQLCDFVCDFIERNQKQPFFVYYPMVLVHDPFVPTPDNLGDRKPVYALNKAPRDPAERKKNFVAMVEYMDKIVGKIVKQVEAVDQLDNTIILFTADNGTNKSIRSAWNGTQWQGGKGGLKDNGTHVPLVAYWQGHTPEGKVLDDLIDFTDFYATFAEAAGVKLGERDPTDGQSFLAQLNGKPGKPRDWVFCHYQPYWNKQPGQFIRNAQFKLYRDGRFYQVPPDYGEQSDLSQSKDAATNRVKLRLKGWLDTAPPAPENRKAGANTKDRPLFPDWNSLGGAAR